MMTALRGELAVVVAVLAMACARFKADPWRGVRAEPRVKVVNLVGHECLVDATSEAGEMRILGVVEARDSAEWRLPFADQKVIVRICTFPTVVDVDGPHVWTLTTHSKEPK